MVHVPGTRHKAADTLSRHPSGDFHPAKMFLTDYASATRSTTSPDTGIHKLGLNTDDPDAAEVLATTSLSSLQPITWDKMKLATASDANLRQLLDIFNDGMPDTRCDLPVGLQDYHQFRDNLYTTNGLQGSHRYTTILTSGLSHCSLRSPSKHFIHDCWCRILSFLVRDHTPYRTRQGKMQPLPQDGTIKAKRTTC